MDQYDDIPSPLHVQGVPRGSRAALQRTWIEVDDDDSDSDSAAPAPIPRRRSSSLGSRVPTFQRTTSTHHEPSIPNKSPLRLRPQTSPSTPSDVPSSPRLRNFSHPFKDNQDVGSLREQFQKATLSEEPPQRKPLPRRRPSRPLTTRKSSLIPPTLKRWSSLETIESVATVPSTHDGTPRPSHERSSTEFSTLDEEDGPSTPHIFSSARPSSIKSSGTSSTTPSLRRLRTLDSASTSSIIQKLTPRKFKEPLMEPDRLEIERKVSLDQVSHRDSSSSSAVTISSGRPSELYNYTSTSTSNRSQDSSEWKSSDFDTSRLTEAELKKCKKKGINPALFAEMKAARKGKWMSVIGGNAVL